MTNRNKIALTVLAVLACAVGARLLFGWRSQPQLPPSDKVFKTVDGLFTAITARDEAALALCERRLSEYKQQGILSSAVAARLERAIAAAHRGQWESSARQLYDFMLGQRREQPSRTGPVHTAMR